MFSPLPLPPGGRLEANRDPPQPPPLPLPISTSTNSPSSNATPHYSFSLFDLPELKSFNPNFYLTENHHISYLKFLIQYFHLKQRDEFIYFLKALERLENPLCVPLVIQGSAAGESTISTSGHVTFSIDHEKFQEALLAIGLSSCRRDIFETAFQIGELIISTRSLTESRLRGQMLLSFPTKPPLRQSVERVEPDEEDNNGSTEKEEEIQEEYADYICCICLDIMNDPVSLPCGHSGCQGCFRKYLETSPLLASHVCPVCRVVIPLYHPLNVTVALRSAIQRFAPLIKKPSKLLPISLATIISDEANIVNDFGAESRRNLESLFDELSTPLPEEAIMEVAHPTAFTPSAASPLFSGQLLSQLLSHFTDSLSTENYVNQIVGSSSNESSRYFSEHLFPHKLGEAFAHNPIPDTSMILLFRRAGIFAEESEAVQLLSEKYLAMTRSVVEDILWVSLSYSRDDAPLTVLRSNEVLTILKQRNFMVYGHGGIKGINYVWTESLSALLSQIYPHMFLSPSGLAVVHDAIADVFDSFLTTTLSHMSKTPPTPSSSARPLDRDHSRVILAPLLSPSRGGEDSPFMVPMALPGESSDNSSTQPTSSHTIITLADIQRILILVFREDVLAYSTKDLQKLIRNLTPLAERTAADAPMVLSLLDEYQTASNLTLPIHITIYLAYQLYRVVLTIPAACYLTMLCEYIAAEILELSGRSAEETSDHCIFASHVHNSIVNDSEIFHTCPGAIKHNRRIEIGQHGVDDPNLQNYQILRDTLLSSSPHGIIIDPLTGCHVSSRYADCHHLDIACSIKSASQRAQLAYDLCSPQQQTIIDSYRQNTFRIRRDYIYATQSFATLPTIPTELFISILSEITQKAQERLGECALSPEDATWMEKRNVLWTMESVVLLQLAVEKSLVTKLETLQVSRGQDRNWNRVMSAKDVRRLFGSDDDH